MTTQTTNADVFAWMIRTLVSCRREAEKMGLEDLSQLINLAIFQTALDWEGIDPAPSGKNDHLESLLRLKMKLAYSQTDENVVVLNSKTAGEV
ncbi:hypothetical protein E2A64_07835 [Pseudohoeflea suaedae]|uniref:Uncharacterized protein n=1 Tax=Pseudohoeflea suaedae TaxID=877384 RepID=A0A4R5PQS4_9HYPH|nr:hypothetical protein [Pseudohoeflea suaedae]TDH38987.1 hypothetical protein E2A64_07835 [Pseudohoeflea suaedae]